MLLTLAREGVDDFLLDTLLALGQALVLQSSFSISTYILSNSRTHLSYGHAGLMGGR